MTTNKNLKQKAYKWKQDSESEWHTQNNRQKLS